MFAVTEKLPLLYNSILNAVGNNTENGMLFSMKYWFPWKKCFPTVWSKQAVFIAYCILRSTRSMWRDDKSIWNSLCKLVLPPHWQWWLSVIQRHRRMEQCSVLCWNVGFH